MPSYFNKFIGRFTGYIIQGDPVCPACGSTAVNQVGFAGYNRRHQCMECGSCTWIDRY